MRISFLVLCVVPVLALLSTALLTHYYPATAVPAHLTTMALLGALIVEFYLFTFRKISFACSYFPGKANLHFIFWVGLFASIWWIPDIASFEGCMLSHPYDMVVLLACLAVAAGLTHLLANLHAYRATELIFKEEETGMVILKLQ